MSCIPERLSHLEAAISSETLPSSAPLVHRLQRLEEHCLGGSGIGGQVLARLCRVEESTFGSSSNGVGGLPREMEIPSSSMVCIPDRLEHLEAAIFPDAPPTVGPILSRVQQLEEQALGMKCGGGRTITRICRLEESIFGAQSCGTNGLPREREGQFAGVVGIPERLEHLEAAFFSDPAPTATPLMDRLQSLEAQCLGAQGIGGRFLARVSFLEESAFGVQSRGASGLPRELEVNYRAGDYAQGGRPTYDRPSDWHRANIDSLSESELQRLSRFALRDHADSLQKVLGNMVGPQPDNYDELISWILAAQRASQRPDFPSNGRSLFGEGMLLAEAHSAETRDMILQFPGLAEAVVKDIRQGIRKFHSGTYGDDFGTSQQKLAEDIYGQYCLDRPNSFWGYIDKFHKFTVAVGPMAFAGSMPYFSYKVAYPQQWSFKDQAAWITVFFTLKDPEIARFNVELEPRILADCGGVGNARLPISSELELRSLDRMSLCDRADLLYRTLGPERIAIRPPDAPEELVLWILRIQRLHLDDPRAVVLSEDTRVPILSDFELRAMDRVALRQHARFLSSKLGSDRVGMGIPTLDSDVPEWIQRVQRSQLPFEKPSSPGFSASSSLRGKSPVRSTSQLPFEKPSSPGFSASSSLRGKSPIRSSSGRVVDDLYDTRSYQDRLDNLGTRLAHRDEPIYSRADEPPYKRSVGPQRDELVYQSSVMRSVSPRRDELVYQSSVSPSQRWR